MIHLPGGSLRAMPLWKRGLVWLLTFAVILASGGLLLAWLGFAPVSASAGHWPITHWFLHFAMRNAVETRSLGIEAPVLDDPAAILKGAGHYATGCAPCHGAPGEPPPLIPRQSTPKPPFLPPEITEWQPEHLFWIVKHGIKFSGMPAWPALNREDEIWAMVAFLQQLPELTPERYRELAYGPRASASIGGEVSPSRLRSLGGPLDPVLNDCARCHGPQGTGRGTGAVPKLANQQEAYLLASLEAFSRGERHSGIMQPIAAGLDDTTLAALAEHFADRVIDEETVDAETNNRTAEEADAISRGGRIADQGVPELGIPACKDCHGPKEGMRNPFYPNLAGQYSDYLLLQLRLFKSENRGGTPYAHIMRTVAERLTAEQMWDVAIYYSSLGSASSESASLETSGN